MIQCRDCEFYHEGADGTPHLMCNPFTNIKEKECLDKLQLVQLTVMARSHQSTLDMHRRLAPLQEKMFKHMEREIDQAEDAESWKREADEEEDTDDPFYL